MGVKVSGRTAEALVLLAALIWGIAFYFQKAAMDYVGPLTFLGLRSTIAAAVLSPFALRESREGSSLLPIAALGGLLFFLAAATQQIGIVETTVTNTGFLTALYVVVTPFIVWGLKRQPPGPAVWIGAALAFIGTWALSGGSYAAFHRGDWLIALSSVFWSGFIVTTGWSGKYARPLSYVCLQFLVVAVCSSASALIWEDPTPAAIASGIVPILYVGVLSSALTFGLMAVALKQVPPAKATILLSTETLFAAIAGAIMLGERLPLIGWFGAALMLTAVLTVQLGRRETT